VTLTSPAWASILAPKLLGFFLVAFSGYWLWRSCEFTIGLLLGIRRLHATQRRDWLALGNGVSGFEHLHHLVLVPTYMESDEVLSETLHYLAAQTLPRQRIGVVLGFEERDPHASARAARLSQRFADCFGQWLVTIHPDLLVTVCDADSRLDPQYLAALGHQMLTHPDGRLHIYQPAILFYANHARLPLPLRAVSSVFSLYSLARLAASHKLVPQSTYSLTWSVARQVEFWDVDVVPEDSHMFFKVWLHLGQRVRTRAIYLPVYADAAEGATWGRSAACTYQQIRRWAWGVSDVPYLALRGLQARNIPWHSRVARVGWYVEEHLVWPSHWFLLTLGGLLPPLLNPDYARTALGLWQTEAFSTLLGLCLPSMVLAIGADALLKWRSHGELDLATVIGEGIAFALLPVTGLALVALPALDAHTRLLFGRSLAYQVTEKQPRPETLEDVANRRYAAPLRGTT
jgi:hypothetical protein